MRTTFTLIATLGVAAAANAQSIILDGTLDAAYSKPLVLQNTQTGFGDASQGNIDVCFGSELDGAYAYVDSGFLFLMLTGNLESNFNKLEIFIDGAPGGQNRLRGNNPDVDFNGLNRMGDNGTGNGLTFDKGFAPDLWVSLTCGGTQFAVFMNQAQLLTKGGGTGGYLGTGGAGLAGSTTFKSGFGFGLDNSNTGGVVGGTELGNGGGVSTGVEVKIPLAAIPGYTSGDLRICAFINGGGHDFVSNQVLGPIGGGPNFGEPRNVNFANVPGDQFFTVSVSSGPACPADLDNSGAVDASDLAALLSGWGTASGDIDGSGTTDAADLAALLSAWGACN